MTHKAKRKAVAHACEKHGLSQRRACSILAVDRSSIRYKSTRPDDTDLRAAMKKVASERRQFGDRRIHVMPERQGIMMNQKSILLVPDDPNQRILSAMLASPAEQGKPGLGICAFTDGRRFRKLTIVDDFSRECLALGADTSLSGLRITRELAALIKRLSNPSTNVIDNGTELTGTVVPKWC